MNPISAAFTLSYEISPIILTNGLASFSPLGLPLVAITEALSTAYTTNPFQLISGQGITIPSQPFFTWRPLPGSTLWKSEVAEFPFYTNRIAANSQLQQPLNISMLGHCPAGKDSPFGVKIATMTALQSVIQNHINAGGTFTVLTPSYIYTDCLLTSMTDVSTGETNQAQVTWQLDFTQPLITFPSGLGALNDVMTALTDGATKVLS
jgi:hypothetical protein